MIVGIFHQGSGLGNQLARYVATRVRAADLGVDWGMTYRDDGSGKEPGFKGKFFLDQPMLHERPRILRYWEEKKIIDDNGVDIRGYDPEFNFIKDYTLIDGEFQDERYWEHREREVDEWLKVQPANVPDDLCMIGFRGGEFSIYPDLFLTKEYWDEGIARMREINPHMKFEVQTDDKPLAEAFFNYEFPVVHDIGLNWRNMRYAKHAIISNSSFNILPRWLRNGVTVAPRYWGRRNTKTWSLGQNYYKRFVHI